MLNRKVPGTFFLKECAWCQCAVIFYAIMVSRKMAAQ